MIDSIILTVAVITLKRLETCEMLQSALMPGHTMVFIALDSSILFKVKA